MGYEATKGFADFHSDPCLVSMKAPNEKEIPEGRVDVQLVALLRSVSVDKDVLMRVRSPVCLCLAAVVQKRTKRRRRHRFFVCVGEE